MENVSDITSDQLQALRENEECFQTCSDIAEAVIGMQMEKNTLSINTQQAIYVLFSSIDYSLDI